MTLPKTEFEQLNKAAYHAEKVASRRLAIKESISPEQALRQTLERSAGAKGLQQLLINREAHASAQLARLADKRQSKFDARVSKQSKNQVAAHVWQAWFDGSARPNPGRCGIGGVLKGPNNVQFEICRDAGYGNSSEAEYLALIALLEIAVQHMATPLVIYGDSRVVIDDVMHAQGIVASSLTQYRKRALLLKAQLDEVHLRWIPRHKNGEADMLSQRASNLGAAHQSL